VIVVSDIVITARLAQVVACPIAEEAKIAKEQNKAGRISSASLSPACSSPVKALRFRGMSTDVRRIMRTDRKMTGNLDCDASENVAEITSSKAHDQVFCSAQVNFEVTPASEPYP
jgi:hypothetical protein